MRVKFVPQNIEVEVTPNKSILDIANENDVYIKSVCKGVPSCAECRVRVTEGEFNVFPPASKELNLIGTAYFVDQRRLSCQLRCFGDVTIDLTEQLEKQNTLTKRPRGGNKEKESEATATQARTGNIIFEAANQEDKMAREDKKRLAAEKALEKEEQRRELERIRARHRNQGQPPKKSDPSDEE
jgi:ferredoxin